MSDDQYLAQAEQIVEEEFMRCDQEGEREQSFAYFRPWVIEQIAGRLRAEARVRELLEQPH
jgi:hypothetical protein